MSGLDMMMRALGVDPAEIMKTAEDFQTSLKQFVAVAGDIRDRVERIETRLIDLQIQVASLRNADPALPDLVLPMLTAFPFTSHEQAYEMFTAPDGVKNE